MHFVSFKYIIHIQRLNKYC